MTSAISCIRRSASRCRRCRDGIRKPQHPFFAGPRGSISNAFVVCANTARRGPLKQPDIVGKGLPTYDSWCASGARSWCASGARDSDAARVGHRARAPSRLAPPMTISCFRRSAILCRRRRDGIDRPLRSIVANPPGIALGRPGLGPNASRLCSLGAKTHRAGASRQPDIVGKGLPTYDSWCPSGARSWCASGARDSDAARVGHRARTPSRSRSGRSAILCRRRRDGIDRPLRSIVANPPGIALAQPGFGPNAGRLCNLGGKTHRTAEPKQPDSVGKGLPTYDSWCASGVRVLRKVRPRDRGVSAHDRLGERR
jgi:hypothetical protein